MSETSLLPLCCVDAVLIDDTIATVEQLKQLLLARPPEQGKHTDDGVAGPSPAILFYRGTLPIALRAAPASDAQRRSPMTISINDSDSMANEDEVSTTGKRAADVSLYVMQFHCLMLPPHVDVDSPLDRVADDDQVEAFQRNFVDDEVQRLEHSLSSLDTAQKQALSPPPSWRSVAARSTTVAGSCGAPLLPAASSNMALLFPSVLEGSMRVSEWVDACHDGAFLDRIHYSYTVLLHFFGWRLHDEETGDVDRHRNWRQRYEALAAPRALKSYALLSRMLRILVELRMPSYAARFLKFLVDEFRAGRMLALMPPYDAVWFPMVAAVGGLDVSVIQQLERHRRRVGLTSSEDDEGE